MSWLSPENIKDTSYEEARSMSWADLEALRERDPEYAFHLESCYSDVIAMNELIAWGNFANYQEAKNWLIQQGISSE